MYKVTHETKRAVSPGAEELLGLYFPILDHGFIALCDYMGTDSCIEQAARVSYGAGTRQASKTRDLLRYLRRHKHSSPSEMVELKFHCCMPIFVARQWVRHRTASLNEYSGRYSLMPMLFYTPEKEQFQKQSSSNNQGRNGFIEDSKYTAAVEQWNKNRLDNKRLYEDLTSNDIAREIARIDLPLSTYTQWYWKIDLHNLLHFLTLRVDSHAQWEIQEYGKVMAGMLKMIAPISYEAWIDYDVCGVCLSKDERHLLRKLVTPYVGRDKRNAIVVDDNNTIVSIDETTNLSKREILEFMSKLEPIVEPNFDLDLSSAKPAEFFEQKMKEAVPQVDLK